MTESSHLAKDRLGEINSTSLPQLTELFKAVCHSQKWAETMAHSAPFETLEDLKNKGQSAWEQCGESDWLESLDGHPKIGDKAKGSGLASKWSKGEQSMAQSGDAEVLEKLRQSQSAYQEKFGFIFLICATGLSSQEILASVEERLQHDRSEELRTISQEQAKINQLRLEKLLNS